MCAAYTLNIGNQFGYVLPGNNSDVIFQAWEQIRMQPI